MKGHLGKEPTLHSLSLNLLTSLPPGFKVFGSLCGLQHLLLRFQGVTFCFEHFRVERGGTSKGMQSADQDDFSLKRVQQADAVKFRSTLD